MSDENQTIPLNADSSPDAIVDLLFAMKVKDVMTHDVASIPPDYTLRQTQQLMKERRITGVPVVLGKNLAGIISMEDIITALDNGTIEEVVSKHMTRNIIVLQESMPLSFAVSYFNKYKFGRFPVLNSENELCGIVTSSDVNTALLVAINKAYSRLQEATNPVQQMPTIPNRVMEFKTEAFNFETAGQASTEVKRVLRSMGIDSSLTRRIGIASYELEINQVIHSKGGVMRYYITPEKLTIEAVDVGPGIPDISKALTEGFSTATEQVRALGFGAGMGLPNTRRNSDDFDITSSAETGTTVHAYFYFKGKPEESTASGTGGAASQTAGSEGGTSGAGTANGGNA